MPGRESEYLNVLASLLSFTGGLEANIYMYSALVQDSQEIENKISHVYSSEVLPAKTPQSLFRLFATNLHKMSPVKVAQHRRLP